MNPINTCLSRAGLLTVTLWAHHPVLAAPKPGAMEYGPAFSTFFGASAGPAAMVTDRQGAVYISGTTRDPHFPTTPGAYARTARGDTDAFVAKFSPDGQLVFSTLIGGGKADTGGCLRVDDQGNVYLAGRTSSPDFPTTAGAYQ